MRLTGGPAPAIRSRWRLVLSLFAVTALASCQRRSAVVPRPPPPPPAPVVVVTMREFRFDYPPKVPAGRVVFRFVNAGRLIHRPSLLPLAEDLPSLDEQLRGGQRRPVTPFAGILDRGPGQSASFAVDLAPGRRYGIICFVRDADGSSHALKGMNTEFRAGGGRPGPRPPS